MRYIHDKGCSIRNKETEKMGFANLVLLYQIPFERLEVSKESGFVSFLAENERVPFI